MAEKARELLHGVEFTLDWYREFLRRLRADHRGFGTFSGAPDAGEVLLRHDVDLSTEAALQVARLEAEMGISATYCFLVTSRLYNPLDREHRAHIGDIAALGHQVALHFSTHEYWTDIEPSERDVARAVEQELSVLGSAAGVGRPVVSFHVPPDWVVDRDFRGFQSTYAPAYFSDIGYVADSMQRWREEPPTDEELRGTLQVLTHPGLWGEEDATFEERVDGAVAAACRRAAGKADLELIPPAFSGSRGGGASDD